MNAADIHSVVIFPENAVDFLGQKNLTVEKIVFPTTYQPDAPI